MSTSEKIPDAGSTDTAVVADEYVRGFDAIADARNSAISSSDRKRPRLEDKKPNTPSFFPLGLQDPGTSVDDDMKGAKKAVINAYLNSCSDYLGFDEHDKEPVRIEGNDRRAEDESLLNLSERPTENKFWRDGEEVVLNDGEDGLSTDYRVRCVFSSITKTLDLISRCRNSVMTKNKALKRTLNFLEQEIRLMNSERNKEKFYMQVISAVRNFLLALDTSKGSRKVIANQIDPVTCYLPQDLLKRLCRFNGFGSVSNYGYMECKFNIPIKLIFMGNLETKLYQDSEHGDNTVFNIELCGHFGTYFYECLENIYGVCFDKLNEEVRRYRKHKALRDIRHDAMLTQLKAGDMSSLMRLNVSTDRASFYKFGGSDRDTTDGFFEDLGDLTRRDTIRIIGTSGKMNSETRLCYTCYDSEELAVTENDPQEEVDALFVSSFIRFRIHPEGSVQMDVYTRNALRLETDCCV